MFLHRKCNWRPAAKSEALNGTPASEPTGNRERTPPAKQKYSKAEKAAFKAEKEATAAKAEASEAKKRAKSEKRKAAKAKKQPGAFTAVVANGISPLDP